MDINIKSLSGKIIKVNVNKTDTIGQIKEHVQDMEGIHPSYQRLIFNGNLLPNHKIISESNIIQGSVLHMFLELRGGSTKSNNNDIYSDSDMSDEKTQLIATPDNDDVLYDISFSSISSSNCSRRYSTNSTSSTLSLDDDNSYSNAKTCCVII